MTIEDPRFSGIESELSNVSQDGFEPVEASIVLAQADPQPLPVEGADEGEQESVELVLPEEVEADENNVVRLPQGVTIDDIRVDGANLVLVQADGAEITVLNGAIRVPTFIIGDVEISEEVLLVALETSGIDVAAGPDGSYSVVGGGPQSSGGNFD